MVMQQPMMAAPMMAAPMMASPQPQVTVVNTGTPTTAGQLSGIRQEMAKIKPHELNQVGKNNAASRLRGLISQENDRFAAIEQEHLAKIAAAEMMVKQLTPDECCTIC